MSRKRQTAEEIVAKLRHVDVLASQGWPVAKAIRTMGYRGNGLREAVSMLLP